MKWFFKISKLALIIFIMSCLIRLVFVFVLDSGFISMGTEEKEKKEAEMKKNENMGENGIDAGKYPETGDEGGNTGRTEEESDIRDTGEYFLTSREVSLINNISLTDKVKGLSILCKVKKDDFNRLVSIVKGGITSGEYDELKQIFERNLSQKDIEELNGLMLKNKKLYAEGSIGD